MSEEDISNYKKYINNFDIIKYTVLDNEGNCWYSAEYIDKILKKQDKEIERLNNIINEFDKWLLGEQMMFYKGTDAKTLINFNETINKWLELKGSE